MEHPPHILELKSSPLPANEFERLAFLRNLRLESADPFEEIQGLCEVAAGLANCPIAIVTVIEETKQEFLASVGVEDLHGTDREISFCAHAIMASEQLEVPDALLDSRFCENPMVLEAPGVRSYLGTVLEPEANMRIGTLCVIDTEPRGFSEDVKASLLQIGKAISSLLTSHREKLQLIDYAFDIKAQNIEMLDLADSLRKSVKELTAAEKAKGEFLSIISHELRTPLTLVKGSLGLMKNSAVIADEQKAQRLVNVAYDSNERLLSLIEDILLIQKLDRDKSQVPLDRVDLAESINTEVSKCSDETQSREITLTVSGVEQPCLVKGDKGQLDRVVASILSNALKFSKQRGNVKVTLLSSGTGPQILVEDDGVGISEDSDERVFGLFSQVDSSDTRSRNGAGLGMYISKEILKRHNATINYKSELGVGTTFSVNFPEQVLQ